MLGKAIAIAAYAFQGKKDKGGKAYILHCIRVMNAVAHLGDEIMQVAILHDLVEDCPQWTLERLLKEGFSHKVVTAIGCLTHDKKVPYDEYIKIISSNPMATVVKLADLRDNSDITRMKDLRKKDFDRLEKYHRSYKYLSE